MSNPRAYYSSTTTRVVKNNEIGHFEAPSVRHILTQRGNPYRSTCQVEWKFDGFANIRMFSFLCKKQACHQGGIRVIAVSCASCDMRELATTCHRTTAVLLLVSSPQYGQTSRNHKRKKWINEALVKTVCGHGCLTGKLQERWKAAKCSTTFFVVC